MKKSTKKYLLYGAGAYVLLASGLLGASRVQTLRYDRDEAKRDRDDIMRRYNEASSAEGRKANEVRAECRATIRALEESYEKEIEQYRYDLEGYQQTIGSFYNAQKGGMQITILNRELDKTVQQIRDRVGYYQGSNNYTLRQYLADEGFAGAFYERTEQYHPATGWNDFSKPITLNVSY